jgi:hypothetical protein
MSNYFFKQQNVTNPTNITTIISGGPTIVSNNYGGFPTSTLPVYPIIERPLNINFVDNSASYVVANNTYPNTPSNDLSNRCSIPSTLYTVTSNFTVPTGAKYISGYCVGGGGGGGGAGGAGNNGFGKSNRGGDGGDGANGNYCAIVQYGALSTNVATTVTISVGAAGAVGAGGAEGSNNNANSGKSGTDGGIGGDTTITISNFGIICEANGGGGGGGGGSGNVNNAGGTGGIGVQTSGVINAPLGTFKQSTTSFVAPYPPLDTAIGGLQGTGGNGGNASGNAGNAGKAGYAVIYFLYD